MRSLEFFLGYCSTKLFEPVCAANIVNRNESLKFPNGISLDHHKATRRGSFAWSTLPTWSPVKREPLPSNANSLTLVLEIIESKLGAEHAGASE